MIKIIFLDFDDTVYSHTTNKIPEKTVKAINEAHDNGCKIFFCTGRAVNEFSVFDLSSVKIDGMICCNGQLVYINNQLIYSNSLNNQATKFIIDLFTKKKIPIILIEEKDFYINYINDFVSKVQHSISSPLPPIKTYSGNSIYMASCFFDNEEAKNTLLSISNEVNYAFWRTGGIDLFPKNTSKVNGIKEVLKYYNISVNDCMCIGDGENDIEMIKYCAVGVAMGNSNDHVKSAANYVTDSIDDDGVYSAFLHFNVIKGE